MKSQQTPSLLILFGLSVATTPFILTILLLHSFGKLLEEMGTWSEEIFRAEQLPILNLSDGDR